MYSTNVLIICGSREIIPKIDDKCPLYESSIDPLSFAIENLQATVRILPENDEELKVGVRADAGL
ncbi:hypothetical protein WAI453_005382 [Rhynchosporium graminicola]